MSGGKVLPAPQRLTESEARRMLALGLQRVVKAHGPSGVALDAWCDEKTIRNARDETTSLKLHTTLNLLALDVTALDELLAAYGFRLAPLYADEAHDLRMISGLASVAGALADANADGVRDHRETLVVADALRPLLPQLAMIIEQADRLRSGRAGG